MVNEKPICIIGGYDKLSKYLFKVLRKKYRSTIFINLLSTTYHDKNLYNYLTASAFNSSKTAIVDKLENSRYAVGKILNIDWDVEKIIIDYEAKENGVLVLSEIYYPARWKAYIDNKEVQVLKANGVLRAVEVKAGTNKMTFEYDNSLFQILHVISNLIVLFISFYLLKPLVMALLKNFR